MIVGGTASLLGMKHRILSEVRTLAKSPTYAERVRIETFKVHKPPAKDNYVAWLGGRSGYVCYLVFDFNITYVVTFPVKGKRYFFE